MNEVYVIDACSLINAAHNYNISKKAFNHIWRTLEEKIECGELISSSEILLELKDQDLAKWAKNHDECFLPLSKDIQLKAREILKEFPQLIKMRSSGNSNGDPFLVATAIIHQGTIVTDEGTKANGIPAVCQKLGIKYMKSSEYFNIILD